MTTVTEMTQELKFSPHNCKQTSVDNRARCPFFTLSPAQKKPKEDGVSTQSQRGKRRPGVRSHESTGLNVHI
ncbi:hypothetical protein ACOMHN_041280 [Nucella lapillus]